jgi:hypothetical protein
MFEVIYLFAAFGVASAIAYMIASCIQIKIGKYVDSRFWRRHDEQ